jgi:uncharacterized protein (DUF1330 family)
MAAYMIFIRDSVKNPDELAKYAALAANARGEHQLKPLVVYGTHETLEGLPADGIVMLEFPTQQAARDWYHSPAYQEAKHHRELGADFRVIMVEGL